MTRRLLILLCLCLAGTVSWAQHAFSGTVTDEKNEPLPGAQVLLMENDSIYAVSLTDKDGKFALRNVRYGTYDLRILFPGYTPFEDKREIKNDQHYKFSLAPEINVDLENIEIVANRNDQVKRTATGQIFFLSEKAKNSGDPYLALKEVPRLVSDEAQRSIKMEDGSSPLILINGIAVNSGITPIDPKEIESIEVVDVVSARYLRTGARHILNIKLKEKREPYRFFEAMTRHDLPLRVGMGAVYFEIGNSKYSLYGRGAADYTYHDDMELNSWQKGITYNKGSFSTNRADKRGYIGELLFKWMATRNDFLAFHLYAKNNKKQSDISGEGTYETETLQPFDYTGSDLDKSNLLTGSLYHKHNFSEQKTLETTLAFNKNWNINDGERAESYPDRLYRNLFQYDNKRSSTSLNLDYSWNISSSSNLNIGNETHYVTDRIDETTSSNPVFHHREWSEYLYGTYNGKIESLYYMLSAGVEGFWLKAGNKKADYIRPKASVSGTYNFSDSHSVRLSYTLNNQAPSVGQLNPYNTSTDSLVRSIGNPLLKPQQEHGPNLTYTFNGNGIYLSPYVYYNLHTDIIEPYGYSENDIYISTFRNQGKYQELYAGGTISFRVGNLGQVYAGAAHHVDYFEGQHGHTSFLGNAGFSFNYKKWYFGGSVNYRNRAYTAISKIKYRTPEYSMIQANYTFFPGFYLAIALQYLNGPQHTEAWTYGADYHSYYEQKNKDESLRPWILLRYTFRKNDKRKIKLDNVVRSREDGIKLK